MSTNMQREIILLSKLQPHPDNPRLFLREDVVNGICEQIKLKGFEDRHAPYIRKIGEDGFYQIVSGHQRTEGAKRAELKKIPCVVIEMTDEEAFRELLLSNLQGELTNLEIGVHVLKSVGRGRRGRGNKGDGVKEYARLFGKSRTTIEEWVVAAEVANKSDAQASLLVEYTKALSIIHRAPETDWPRLVAAMLAGELV